MTRSSCLIAGVYAIFFFCCTGFGLATRLGYDDVMNSTFAWAPPLSRLIVGLITPFTGFYRPAGSAVYRILLAAFGLDPLPFRIFVYLLLLINIFLVYRLAGSLSRSAEVGAMAALIYTYHGRLAEIYLNNGTVYDVLCGTFTLLSLLYYTGIRQQNRLLSAKEFLVFTALFILAINAKEMAAIVPALILSYELLYHRGRRALLLQALPVIVTASIVIGAAYAKTGSGSEMHDHPAYRMTFSVEQFLNHWRLLTNGLVYAAGKGVSTAKMLTLWLVLAAATLVSRKHCRAFFLAFALLAPLPIIFIPYRGFFVMYIPMAGWSMLAASLLVDGKNWLLRKAWKSASLTGNPFGLERVLLFATVGFLVAWIPMHDPLSQRTHKDPEQAIVAATTRDILYLNEGLPRNANVLFLHDRFPADAYGTGMICRLLYRDRDLSVDRPTMMDHTPDEASYDRVFDYVGGHLAVVRRRTAEANGGRFMIYPK